MLYGFSSDTAEPGSWKKKLPLPPSSPFQKTLRLAKHRFPQPLHFKSLPAPPLPTTWEDFSPSLFLVSCLTKCTLFVHLYSYVILSGGAVHVSSLPYLILHLPTRNLPVFYCTVPILDRNHSSKHYLLQSTQQWALLYMFQAARFELTLLLQWLQSIRISHERNKK